MGDGKKIWKGIEGLVGEELEGGQGSQTYGEAGRWVEGLWIDGWRSAEAKWRAVHGGRGYQMGNRLAEMRAELRVQGLAGG